MRESGAEAPSAARRSRRGDLPGEIFTARAGHIADDVECRLRETIGVEIVRRHDGPVVGGVSEPVRTEVADRDGHRKRVDRLIEVLSRELRTFEPPDDAG